MERCRLGLLARSKLPPAVRGAASCSTTSAADGRAGPLAAFTRLCHHRHGRRQRGGTRGGPASSSPLRPGFETRSAASFDLSAACKFFSSSRSAAEPDASTTASSSAPPRMSVSQMLKKMRADALGTPFWPDGVPHLPYVETAAPQLIPEKRTFKEWLTSNIDNPEDVKWEREDMKREILRGYVLDIQDIRQNKTKYFTAMNRLTQAERSNYMHDLFGKTLSNEREHLLNIIKGKTSLVAFSYNMLGAGHADTYIKPFIEAFGVGGDRFQVTHICVEVSRLRWIVARPFRYRLRKLIPKELHSKYIFWNGYLPLVHRKLLKQTNRFLGYVYIVDPDLRVRWTAHGNAKPEELKSMVNLAKELDHRQLKKEASAVRLQELPGAKDGKISL